MEKTISSRQLGLIAFISSFALKLTILPSLLFEEVQTDTVLVVILLCSIDFLSFLVIFYLLKKNQDVSFYQFLSRFFGKIVAKIIFFAIFLVFLFKLLLLLSGGYAYSREVIFPNAPMFLYLFILMVVASSLYLFGQKSFARTTEFFYPIIATMFTVFIIIALITAKLQDVRPLFTSGVGKIFSSWFDYSMVAGDYLFMLLFMGKIKFTSGAKKSIFTHLIFSQVLLITFYLVYALIFRYTATIHPNAISEIVQFLPLPTIIGNFDWLAVTLMMMLFIFQGGLFTICLCESLVTILTFKKVKIKNIESWVIVFLNILVAILIYIVFRNFEDIKLFSVYYLKYLMIFIMSIPYLTLFICKIKDLLEKRRRFKGKKKVLK